LITRMSPAPASKLADGVGRAALVDELHLIVRMPVRTWPAARRSVEEKGRDAGAALFGTHEVVRAATEREVLLAYAMHGFRLSGGSRATARAPT
jgi:hypothetical protein